MNSVVVREPMSREAALHHTAQAKYHADHLREHIAAIYEGDGWRALDYDSFEAWAEAELQQGYKWALKLKNAYVIQQELSAGDDSPQGDHLPTKHAEQLGKLDTAAERQQAYQRALDLAGAEGGKVATRHIRQAVELSQSEKVVRDSGYKVVTHMMASGDVSPSVAAEMIRQLDRLTPQQSTFVCGIMGMHGLTVPALIAPISRLANRLESKVLPEVEMGYLNGKRLAEANLTDWETAAEAARRERFAEDEETRNTNTLVEACVVTVYRTKDGGDATDAARRTLKALRRELSDRDIRELYEELQRESNDLQKAVAAAG